MKANLHNIRTDAPKSPLRYAAFKTVQGWVAVLGSEKGLLAVTLANPSKKSALEELGYTLNNATSDNDFFADITSRMKDYYFGKQVSFDDELDTSWATPFQARVWQAARDISYGQRRSYGWLAEKVGKPRAARAVGQAMGKNKFPIVVPCHRVIAGDGSLGGFTGGLELKKSLLDMERTK